MFLVTGEHIILRLSSLDIIMKSSILEMAMLAELAVATTAVAPANLDTSDTGKFHGQVTP